MVFINLEEKELEQQISHLIEQKELNFESDVQQFEENIEHSMNPKSMDEMITSILKDLGIAEVSLQSTSHLLEPIGNDSESNTKSQEITGIKPKPVIVNLNSVPQEIKDIKVEESTFNFQNLNEKDLTCYEEELKNSQSCLVPKEKSFESPGNLEEETSFSKDLPLCLVPKEKSFGSPGNLEEETSLSKDLPLCLVPKEKNFDSPGNLEEGTSLAKDFPLCPEPKEKIFESQAHFEKEKSSSNETSDNIFNSQIVNENTTKCIQEIEHQIPSNIPEDKALFKIPLLSSNPYVNFVQDFQAKYKGDEVTPSMLATLAFAKWQKMGIEEKQIYKNIKKSHCEKNDQIKKLRALINTLNASEETIFKF